MTKDITAKTSREEARESLHDAHETMAAPARRIEKGPWWFEPAWLAIIAGLVLAMALPPLYKTLLIIGLAAALGGLMAAYRKRHGMWVSGYRSGKTRTISVILVVVLAGIMFGAWFAHDHLDIWWVVPAGAAAGVVISFVFGRLWMWAYRVETEKCS